MTTNPVRGRHAGVLVPLFSATSSRSWGIGEIGDLVPLSGWLRSAGCDLVQLLPVNEMAPGDDSPYSAITAMGIDPLYISVWALDDFAALGGEDALPLAQRTELGTLRAARRVEYRHVRALKLPTLRSCAERFFAEEWPQSTPRAAEFARFVEGQAWWLDDFALFRALRDRFDGAAWWRWPRPLLERADEALNEARRDLATDIRFHQYVQWVADEQWHGARRECAPVMLFGDLPFMVRGDSADVWARHHAFRFDATVGVPPDAFSDTGQDWGLPVYRWDVFAKEEDAWIRERARRSLALFDGYRIDHLVGFYRTYFIPRDGSPRGFVPAHESQQRAQGERLMRLFLDSGACVIAEDLGTVPDFVRASIKRLGLPGYRVLRWERDWDEDGQPFHDPLKWPRVSVATSGTHDTDTLVEWWETSDVAERRALCAIPALKERGLDPSVETCTPAIRDALLELLFASGSDFLIVPIQDVFGWRDRINTPATHGHDNWTWRLPWPVDHLPQVDESRARAETLREWSARHRRARAARRAGGR